MLLVLNRTFGYVPDSSTRLDYPDLDELTLPQRLGVLLENITDSRLPGELKFAPAVMSHMFLDTRLSRRVASIHTGLHPEQPAQRPAKRLRRSLEPNTLSEMVGMIDRLVPVRSFSGEMAILEDEAL